MTTARRALFPLLAVLALGGCAVPMHRDAMPMHGDGMGEPRSRDDVVMAPEPHPAAAEVTVEAGEMWFRPEAVEVAAGEPFNLVLVNAGGVFHDLVIDELGVGLQADPGRTATGGLLVEEPGTYRFRCTVPGHADAGMRGVLTVG